MKTYLFLFCITILFGCNKKDDLRTILETKVDEQVSQVTTNPDLIPEVRSLNIQFIKLAIIYQEEKDPLMKESMRQLIIGTFTEDGKPLIIPCLRDFYDSLIHQSISQ